MATIEVRPEQHAYQLTDGSNGPADDPVGLGDAVGADIATIPDVNLYWILSDAAESGVLSEIKIWLYDGDKWVPYMLSNLASPDNRAVLDSFALDGGWGRIYVEITDKPSSGILNVYVTPHNM